mgnify:FL=1
MNDFLLISLDSPQKIRFERMLNRAKESDPKTWEGFLEIDERDFGDKTNELGQQVGKCMTLADFEILNEGTLEELNKKVEIIYSRILSDQESK